MKSRFVQVVEKRQDLQNHLSYQEAGLASNENRRVSPRLQVLVYNGAISHYRLS
jgi:hypothetical protein